MSGASARYEWRYIWGVMATPSSLLSLFCLQFRLFARHPETGESMERKIEVPQDWTLPQTVQESQRVSLTHTPGVERQSISLPLTAAVGTGGCSSCLPMSSSEIR